MNYILWNYFYISSLHYNFNVVAYRLPYKNDFLCDFECPGDNIVLCTLSSRRSPPAVTQCCVVVRQYCLRDVKWTKKHPAQSHERGREGQRERCHPRMKSERRLEGREGVRDRHRHQPWWEGKLKWHRKMLPPSQRKRGELKESSWETEKGRREVAHS